MGNTMTGTPRIVLDTSVVVDGLRSRRGTAFELLSRVGQGGFEIALSVPLLLEYEDALLRHPELTRLGRTGADAVIDYLCKGAHLQRIFYLWRPRLPDPKDDLLLELAVASRCQAIVTNDLRDLAEADNLGVSVLEPGPFLSGLGVHK
jgi:putative PIN family toxin of toxin-antitoxin system